ncbi:MAG: hypothetical protein U5L46_09000 [Agrobacterium sp.]|nr:hypothetical protein [Agrobacterium sp.]
MGFIHGLFGFAYASMSQTAACFCHHRSGGGKTLGNMKGATNANVFGVRYKF